MKEQEIEQAAKAKYKVHPEPDGYWYPNRAITDLRIDSFKAGAHWALENGGKWIDVEAALPKERGNYITVDQEGDVSIDLFDIKENDFDSVGWITHWMPLPEKP